MGANFKSKNVTKKVKNPQPQQPVMTKKQRKAAMRIEVERLKEAIPHMFYDMAMQIAYHNMDNPDNKITDAFLLKVVKKGEEIDIWGKDAIKVASLQTRNSETNYNNLHYLMGDELFSQMMKYSVSWGYYAVLYDNIYRSHFSF